MAARVALALSAAFLCLVLGWLSAPATPAVVTPAHPLRLAALRLDPAADPAAAAAAALSGDAPRPAGPAAPPVVRLARVERLAPLPPPAPPQADAVLRRSVAAVTEDGGGLSLVLAGGGRRLRPGDAFMGWTLASVTRSGAVLSRRGARREVSFFAPPPSTPGGAEPFGLAAGGGEAAQGRPATLAPPRPAAPMPRAPTAAEYFRGFKG